MGHDMSILAVDVGTSAVKAAVLDENTSEPIGTIGREEYSLSSPVSEAAEVRAQALWQTIAAAARTATRGIPDVQAVGLSVTTPALVLIDKSDRPIGPIWMHLDRRSRMIARQVWQAAGTEFLATTGNLPLPGGMSAICYRQRLTDDPYLSHRVHRYLHLNGWLGLQMTGEAFFDPANACMTGLFGTLTDRAWSPRWCDYFEVDLDWLPPVVCGSTTIGDLRAGPAAELGVPAGIPVKLGTADISTAMLAADMQAGDLLHEAGTTQVLAAFAAQPRPNPERITRLFGVGDRYVYVTHNPVGGVALDWIRQLCFSEQTAEEFRQTMTEARTRATRVTLDPPFLAGDRLEIEAHRAAFRDLTLATDRLDLLAAVLEAMQRCHRKAIAALAHGDDFRTIYLAGEGADVARPLLSDYGAAEVRMLADGSLRGVARLFQCVGD
jgi:xylulokinase